MSVAEIGAGEQPLRPLLYLVTAESAPQTGADFSFEDTDTQLGLSEQVTELFDSTYTAEWLPPMSELSADIRFLVAGRERGAPRLDLVVEYVDWLRSRIEPDNFDGNKEYARGQAGPRIFLDSLSLIARHQKYQVESSRRGRRSPETFRDLMTILNLKKDMKQDIASYARLNPNTPGDVMFNNLLSMMNHARRIAFNDEVGLESSTESNRRYLFGLLAENKVVQALQHDKWPLADHASAELDSAGVDAIVPVDVNPRSAVALQVKSSAALGGMFGITPQGNKNIVVVPMNPLTNDPFNLNRSDAAKLNRYVYGAPRMRLPIAA